MAETDKAVKKMVEGVSKDLPKLVKENKGAAIGAVVGYLLADKLEEKGEITSAVLGGLAGAFIDDKTKGSEF